MIRVVLALLLALTLWPSAAAASPRAWNEGHDELRRTTAEYAHGLVRSAGGLELLRGFQTQPPTGCSRGCTQGCSHGPSSGSPYPLSGYERLALRVRLLVADTPDHAEGAFTPFCERLPYDATAPPSLR